MGHYFENDENLKSNIKEFKCNINDLNFNFKTDNGVFFFFLLDFGTELLIKTVLKEKIYGNILDLGCGYGPIGIILSKVLKLNVDMIDVNKRAVHLTKLNIKDNKCQNINVFLSDGYERVNNKYDFIISNPPIRVGKKKLYELINYSKNYLKEFGKIYLVIRKEQGAKTFISDFSKDYDVKILEKKKGFYIICLKI